MSVVERALKRLQNKGIPQSVRANKSVARVSKKQRPIVKTANQQDWIVGEGKIIEFSTQALSEAGLCATGNTQLADEYRIIKQPIMRKASETGAEGNPRGNLVMVASSFAGEGKTFTSVNLSLSLASERDWKVLLVDVDCKNPQLSRLLGVAEEPGMMDLLKDPSMQLESVVMPTNIDRLSVLPIGSVDENAAEQLTSSRMQDLCDHMASLGGHQIVIFDSSPLLLTAESQILSRSVGQVALVVLANATPRQAVKEAIEKIDGDRAIGLILNKADQGGEFLSYGSYQTYGH